MRPYFVSFILSLFFLISCSPVECVRNSDCALSEECKDSVCRYICDSNGWCPNEDFCIKGLCYSESCHNGDCSFDDSDSDFYDDDVLDDSNALDYDVNFLVDVAVVDIDMMFPYDEDQEENDEDVDNEGRFASVELSFEDTMKLVKDLAEGLIKVDADEDLLDEELSDEDVDSSRSF